MKRLAPIALLLPLAGCISFGAKPPPSLLNLSSAASLAPGETQRSPGAVPQSPALRYDAASR